MSDVADTKPCPWCRQPVGWLSRSMAYGTGASGMEAPMRALGCRTRSCPVKPHTMWRDTQEWKQGRGYFDVNYDKDAIADWNSHSA